MRLPFWATLLTVLGVVVLCSLGTWQYQRWQWKLGVLDMIETEYAKDATKIELSLENPVGTNEFRRGYVIGRYLHENEIRIQSRTYDGVPGYHILTPFENLNKKVILVNRGWVPIEAEMKQEDRVYYPYGLIRLIAMQRSVKKANGFVPENDLENDVWYQINIPQIEKSKNLAFVSGNIFYAEREEPSGEDAYPVSAATKIKPNNNHAQYMVFWFTMAFILILIYVLRFVIPQKT